MSTVRETALAALATLCTTTFSGAFYRDPEKAPDASAAGLAIMTDGEAQVLVETVSPVGFQIEHMADIELSATGTGRKATVDAMQLALNSALAGSRTLGGAVLDARVTEVPVIVEVEQDGTEAVRAAMVRVRLEYVASSPIG